MDKIYNFMYENKCVSIIVDINNNPWFIGNEIAKILGYNNMQKSLSYHIKNTDYKTTYDEFKKKNKMPLRSKNGIELKEQTTMLNENGLYYLLIKSKKTEALEFQKWLVEKVLPQIRKTGSYTENIDNIKKILKKQKKLLDTKNEIIKKLLRKISNKTYDENECVYVIKVQTNVGEMYKIGRTKNMNTRIKKYKTGNENLSVNEIFSCNDSKLVEKIVLYKLESKKYDKNKELIECSFNTITKTIKDTIKELKKGKIDDDFVNGLSALTSESS